jgi:hypothetical protein
MGQGYDRQKTPQTCETPLLSAEERYTPANSEVLASMPRQEEEASTLLVAPATDAPGATTAQPQGGAGSSGAFAEGHNDRYGRRVGAGLRQEQNLGSGQLNFGLGAGAIYGFDPDSSTVGAAAHVSAGNVEYSTQYEGWHAGVGMEWLSAEAGATYSASEGSFAGVDAKVVEVAAEGGYNSGDSRWGYNTRLAAGWGYGFNGGLSVTDQDQDGTLEIAGSVELGPFSASGSLETPLFQSPTLPQFRATPREEARERAHASCHMDAQSAPEIDDNTFARFWAPDTATEAGSGADPAFRQTLDRLQQPRDPRVHPAEGDRRR